MTRLVALCAVLLVLGCKSRGAPEEPSIVEEAPAPEPADMPPPDTGGAAAEPDAKGTIRNLGEVAVAEPADAVVEEPVQTAKPAEPARDLAAEVSAAVGSPAECMRDYKPASAKAIRVSISAVVRPTGMVIEPSASGGGLSANDLRCIEQRVGDVILSPLSGTASERVSTFVTIEYEPPEVEEYDVGAPTPKLENVVQPLPKKEPIAPSGKPIEGPAADPIDGPSGVPIEGPKGVPIEGPRPKPIDGY